MKSLLSQKIYYSKEYSVNKGNCLPQKVMTLMSFVDPSYILTLCGVNSILDNNYLIFTLCGKLPDYFNRKDIVDVKYRIVIVKDIPEYHIFELYHHGSGQTYLPMRQFPSVETVKTSYERVTQIDKEQIYWLWAVYQGNVYRIMSTNPSRFLSKDGNHFTVQSEFVEYYLNTLKV